MYVYVVCLEFLKINEAFTCIDLYLNPSSFHGIRLEPSS